jgi:histidinol dehydrogenase
VLKIIESTNRRAVEALLSPERSRDAATDRRVATIVSDVRRKGDRALLRYAKSLDGLNGPIEIFAREMHKAAAGVPKPVRAAIRVAAKNIRAVAARQVPRSWRLSVTAGVSVEQRVIPLDRVGCYVPGGRYPLPSSLLMTAIPAVAAGVKDVVAVCPRPEPVVMAAAIEAGVSRLFRLGGAHAIAALAYGTESVPRVDKIVGPGNRWVASAKALIASDCGIDFYAGPSEILLVSSTGDPAWIATDLIAQAEHDPDARAVLITPNRKLASQVAAEVAARMPADGPARLSMTRHGGVIVTKSQAEAIELANAAAPEHMVVDDEKTAAQITCVGSLFVGSWTAQVAGDYAIGSNHVLPTAGAARVRGGLSAADFVRQVTVQRVTRAGLSRIGGSVIDLARAEGLNAHAESIVVRLGGVPRPPLDSARGALSDSRRAHNRTRPTSR